MRSTVGAVLGALGLLCALVGRFLVNGVSIAVSGLTGPPQ